MNDFMSQVTFAGDAKVKGQGQRPAAAALERTIIIEAESLVILFVRLYTTRIQGKLSFI